MLELRNIYKRFSGIPAVAGASFTARPGEVTGYLGPNGSGKSTTMKMIAGLMDPSAGEILFEGNPIQHDLIAYKQRMGYVPEEPHLYTHLSGIEYLSMVAQLRNLPPNPPPSRLTGSSTSSTSTATATSRSRHTPRECARRSCSPRRSSTTPICSCSTSLSPDSTSASALVLRSLIQELAGRGKVVLFSSHELETVERICSHVVILHRGKIVADDSIEHLRAIMSLPTLEEIFSQLAVEQDTVAISRQIADLIHA